MLEGRCLPYGNGITYWPLVEIVRGLDLDGVLGGEPDGETARGRILEAVGRAEPRSRSDELYWAFRRLLETLARERPLVLVLDDIQWAEPAFLDLVEYLAGWSRDAPILVCCLARPDLAELRPAWGGPTIQLAPLPREHARSCSRTSPGRSTRTPPTPLGRATGGNPLFLEEMLRMLVEDGVLVERDGRLEPLTAVDSLRVPGDGPGRARGPARPARRGRAGGAAAGGRDRPGLLVGRGRRPLAARGGRRGRRPPPGARPQGADQARRRTFAGEDGFRFGHILIRDAAYDSMPKRSRAELHERFAGWVEDACGRGAELDEIIGHHLEQAYGYRVELGPRGEAERCSPSGRPTGSCAPAGGRLPAATCRRVRRCSAAPPLLAHGDAPARSSAPSSASSSRSGARVSAGGGATR